jgi:Fe2+ transport system protein FeoA
MDCEAATDHRPTGKQVTRLSELGTGCSGRVVAVDGPAELRRRLLEMGFCNGVRVNVIRRAPLGDPTEFRLRSYYLSLRREQARHVQVRVEE